MAYSSNFNGVAFEIDGIWDFDSHICKGTYTSHDIPVSSGFKTHVDQPWEFLAATPFKDWEFRVTYKHPKLNVSSEGVHGSFVFLLGKLFCVKNKKGLIVC